MTSLFKNPKEDMEKQKAEADRIRVKFPDRVPVIVEKKGKDTPDIDKKKFLVPADLTAGQFLYIIRKRVKLSSEHALFLFINNTLIAPNTLMSELFHRQKGENGFLNIIYATEATFGSK
jgi:GABA(A) receptor-associated protein